VIRRPDGMGSFEFVVAASLRATQLMRGCTPRVSESHTTAMTAQLEVAEGKVAPTLNAIELAVDGHDA
jgi:DNA-directed RNA polymerase subunit K/omega